MKHLKPNKVKPKSIISIPKSIKFLNNYQLVHKVTLESHCDIVSLSATMKKNKTAIDLMLIKALRETNSSTNHASFNRTQHPESPIWF